MNTEQWLTRLELESAAQKQSFERSAYTIPLITKTVTYQTTRNAITYTYSGGSYTGSEPERIFVTLSTVTGANTIAALEVKTNGPVYAAPKVSRVPHSGGAKWEILIRANDDGTGWKSTMCELSIHTFVDGDISISEAVS